MAAVEPAQQDALLRERLSGDIYERSAFHRGRLDRAGLGKSGVRKRQDLMRLAPMVLGDVSSPSSLLLHSGGLSMRPNGREAYRHWPLQWVRSGGVPLGYSARDLSLLGDLGRELLQAAGLTRSDVMANLVPQGDNRDYWQLALGAQRAGLSSLALGPDADTAEIDMLGPTVIAGRPEELIRVLDAASAAGGALDRVHTAIVVGTLPTEQQAQKIADRIGDYEGSVIRAWAPDGVLAMWGQCRGGSGLHTWPQAELLEIVDPLTTLPAPPGRSGNLVWSGIGWYGSALVRLDTETPLAIVDGLCPECGRSAPRVEPQEEAPGMVGFLDEYEAITDWAAELQRSANGDELVIWVAPADNASSLMILHEIDAAIGSAQVILAEPSEVERRIAGANGERFGDRRAHVEQS